MGTRTLFSIKTKFDFVNRRSFVREFVYGNVNMVVRSLWVLFCSYGVYVIGSIFRLVFRLKNPEKIEANSNVGFQGEDGHHQTGSSCSHDSEIDKINEEETESSVFMESNKYEFLSGKGISRFIEEPIALSFTIHEFFDCETVIKAPISGVESSEIDFKDKTEELTDFAIEESPGKQEHELLDEENTFQDEDVIPLVSRVSNESDSEKIELEPDVFVAEKTEDSGENEAEQISSENEKDQIFPCDDAEEESPCSSNDFSGFTYEILANDFAQKIPMYIEEEEEETVIPLCSGVSNEIDSQKIELKSDVFVAEETEDSGEKEAEEISSPFEVQSPSKDQTCPLVSEEESTCSSNDFSGFTYEILANDFAQKISMYIEEDELEPGFTRDRSVDSDEEYIELEPHKNTLFTDSLVHEDVAPQMDESLNKANDKSEEKQELVHQEEVSENSEEKVKSSWSNYDVEDETELMFEHQDIIEQLKLELKYARTGGLPTILEEPESEQVNTPKIEQELKPLKIDKKLEHRDCIAEIEKIYKSYSERMRKLDILNFQTMHSVGLLQLKDTIQSQTARKSSVPAIKALLTQPFGSCKQGSGVVDPIKKVIADVHRDFEAVYVGQLCLSWEILHWQYRKIEELEKYDPQGFHQYNQVAGEFQHFQVILQRLIENEPFQGPRVQNYVNNRCVVRNLLQVPIIKDDSLKDKEKKGDGESAFTCQKLLEIAEESMQMFWEFLRVDKDETGLNSQAQISFQDLADTDLWMDILIDLQKKEKKLKDILRCGNCIMKKFQKHEQDGKHHQGLLLAQVELKLISRVLNMSKLTVDQLVWCHDKLQTINFCNRKVLLEPSFLLFPC